MHSLVEQSSMNLHENLVNDNTDIFKQIQKFTENQSETMDKVVYVILHALVIFCLGILLFHTLNWSFSCTHQRH